MLLRVRVTSFLAGFGLASAAAFWQLRQDITTSADFLTAQAQEARDSLDRRVAALEAIVLPKQQPAASTAPAAAAAAATPAAAPVSSLAPTTALVEEVDIFADNTAS